MTHEISRLNDLRRKIKPTLHALLSEIGLYAKGRVDAAQYALTMDIPLEELEETLHEMGFVRNPLSSLKRRDDKKDKEIASWMFLTLMEPIYVFDAIPLPRHQYHVHVFERSDGRLDLYIHKEYWWGTKPRKHYDGKNVEAVPQMLRWKFDYHDIEYEVDNPHT